MKCEFFLKGLVLVRSDRLVWMKTTYTGELMTLESVMLPNCYICLYEQNLERIEYLKQFESEFKTLFGANLADFCNYLVGFHYVKFANAFLSDTPNGVSYNQQTEMKYGKRAAELIGLLIKSTTVGSPV